VRVDGSANYRWQTEQMSGKMKMLVAGRQSPPTLLTNRVKSMQTHSSNILRSYKYRLYPTSAQQITLAHHFGCKRFVYNHFLDQRKHHYDQTGKGMSYEDTANQLVQLKRDGEHEWLKDVNSQVLQQSLVDLDTAYKNFFDRVKKKKAGTHKGKMGFPKFKKKRNYQSFRVPQFFSVNFENNTLVIPKISPIKIILHRPIPDGATIKSVTISKSCSGKYFASFLVEAPKPESLERDGVIALDLGLKSYYATSNGETVPAPQPYVKAQKKLRRVKREHSRKVKGSKNREKARIKLAVQEEKIVNQRADFLHKQSIRLLRKNQTIGMEDLAVKNLLKNHKLAKHIQDAAWSTFTSQLAYKAEWYGGEVYKVGRYFPSSQLCSVCEFKNTALTLKDREWVCPDCGTQHDRDVNAAINVLNEMIKQTTVGHTGSYACGEKVSPTEEALLIEAGTSPRKGRSHRACPGG
jgi:putative transposase